MDRRSFGRFTTAVTFEHQDGRRLEWSSRRHRKHASRLSRIRPQRENLWWAPHRASWWIAVLFVIGSTCFLVAPLPAFLAAVGGSTDALVFFVGSIFFTSAATLQWLETINTDPGPTSSSEGAVRVLAWEPRRIDWWSSGVQLVGTLFFNVTTFRALSVGVDAASYDRVVWRPDALGSVCFLASGCLAYLEVTGGPGRLPPRTLEGALVTVNLLGCVAFAVSAAAAFVVPATGDPVDVAVANAATSLGALAFLVGALLLLPEGARAPT
ncbi:MAG TPA: hypothetical protein VLA97_13755 [Nocardioidaceae bacterium]|nr:hypothetical protein [Nocardioidaceae bacterium]